MKLQIASIALASMVMMSCKQETKTENVSNTAPEEKKELVTAVMTKEGQAKLTPNEVLQELKDGNKRFQNGQSTERDELAQVKGTAAGQYPKAVVLSCLDSRVPVEEVLDQGIGDIFVGRIAGNFANEDLLGSMEFACKAAGAKLVLVIGHQSCGAVKGAIDDVKLGNLTATLSNIKPAVDVSRDFAGEKSSKNDEYVKHVTENNVVHTLATIREKSPLLKEMEDKGEIKIVGAYYNLNNGSLEFMN